LQNYESEDKNLWLTNKQVNFAFPPPQMLPKLVREDLENASKTILGLILWGLNTERIEVGGLNFNCCPVLMFF